MNLCHNKRKRYSYPRIKLVNIINITHYERLIKAVVPAEPLVQRCFLPEGNAD